MSTNEKESPIWSPTPMKREVRQLYEMYARAVDADTARRIEEIDRKLFGAQDAKKK
jgi:hypothetical protein